MVFDGERTQPEYPGNVGGGFAFDAHFAVIAQIDNQGPFNADPIRIEPGDHRIVLQFAPGWPGDPPPKVYNLRAEPCKRYYINVQFRDPGSQEWTPVVDFVETIAECRITPAAK